MDGAAQCDRSLYYPEIPVLKQVAQVAEVDHGRVIAAGSLVMAPVNPDRKAGKIIVPSYGGEDNPALELVPGCLRGAIQAIALPDDGDDNPALAIVPGCLRGALHGHRSRLSR